MNAPRPTGIALRYRIYFWFKGVPEKRLGGPWWVEDFNDRESRNRFFTSLRPFLQAYALHQAPVLPAHDLMSVRPPKEAKVVEVDVEVRWS